MLHFDPNVCFYFLASLFALLDFSIDNYGGTTCSEISAFYDGLRLMVLNCSVQDVHVGFCSLTL